MAAMARPYSLPAPQAAPGSGVFRRLQSHLLDTWSGRVFLGALAVLAIGRSGLPLPDFIAALDAVILAGFGLLYGYRLARFLVHRLLWRIRTKLLVSYLFIAVVPVVLLALFFSIAGLLSLTLVASYMVAAQVETTATQLKAIAHTAAMGIAHDQRAVAEIADRLAPARALHPDLAFSLVRADSVVAAAGTAPRRLPAWLEDKPDFAGLVRDAGGDTIRAVFKNGDAFLLLQVPLDDVLTRPMEARTGIKIVPGVKLETQVGGHGVRIGPGNPEERHKMRAQMRDSEKEAGMTSFALADRTDWENGKAEVEPLQIRFQPMTLLRQLSPASRDIGNVILVRGLTFVGALFLGFYAIALIIGLLLARSITGSVHALSVGTERLRAGDLDHRIRARSRDQLGELAESFNMMTRGIQDLLRESAEKERLEEELRIARRIQMSLLPQGTASMPGLRIAALCLPAAEVGGDYYDLLPLSDTRLGVLVADVSGKGTSAALYMAELKGLVLSLSRITESPARLLSEANKILSANMDSRSFVTMTYAVVDVASQTMRYARAGHNPVIRLEAATKKTHVLTPPGLGLGIDRGARFDEILEEAVTPIASGDIFLFFTDGLSEAMNPESELFGEDRLRALLEAGESLTTEELKEKILSEIRVFAQGAAQHDDMTLVILKVI